MPLRSSAKVNPGQAPDWFIAAYHGLGQAVPNWWRMGQTGTFSPTVQGTPEAAAQHRDAMGRLGYQSAGLAASAAGAYNALRRPVPKVPVPPVGMYRHMNSWNDIVKQKREDLMQEIRRRAAASRGGAGASTTKGWDELAQAAKSQRNGIPSSGEFLRGVRAAPARIAAGLRATPMGMALGGAAEGAVRGYLTPTEEYEQNTGLRGLPARAAGVMGDVGNAMTFGGAGYVGRKVADYIGR